jgi:hypothetical protein
VQNGGSCVFRCPKLPVFWVGNERQLLPTRRLVTRLAISMRAGTETPGIGAPMMPRMPRARRMSHMRRSFMPGVRRRNFSTRQPSSPARRRIPRRLGAK